MSRRALLIVPVIMLAALVLVAGVRIASAQDAPDAINDALEDLSQRVGVPLTLADLDRWVWSQQESPDTSLGCPLPGEEYDPRPTGFYRFVLVYQGSTYDYRVPLNRSSVVLCAPTATTPPPGTPVPTPPATALPTATPDFPTRTLCPDAPPSRLTVGMDIQAAPGAVPRNIRASASTTSAILGQAPEGSALTVVDGPICAEQKVWWQIDYDTLIGWAAEADGSTIYLEPRSETPPDTAQTPSSNVTPPPVTAIYDLPPNREPIRPDNVARLEPLRALAIPDMIQAAAWSPDGMTLAFGGTAGIWLYDVTRLDDSPRRLQVPDAPVNDLAFAPDGITLASAHEDGTLRLWDVTIGGQTAVLNQDGLPVQTVAFTEDGQLLAAGTRSDTVDGNLIPVWEADSQAPVASFSAHTQGVRDLAFNPDGTLLASSSADQTVRLWDMVSATLATVLQGHGAPVDAIGFDASGQWLVAVVENGNVHLWDVTTGEHRVLESDNSGQQSLVFIPQTSLFVTGAGIVLNIWDLDRLETISRLSPLPPDAPTSRVVTALASSPEGAVLVGVTGDGSASQAVLYGVRASDPDQESES